MIIPHVSCRSGCWLLPARDLPVSSSLAKLVRRVNAMRSSPFPRNLVVEEAPSCTPRGSHQFLRRLNDIRAAAVNTCQSAEYCDCFGRLHHARPPIEED